MKIKTIELLNRMANDENYRPKVKCKEITYIYDNTIGDYTNDFNSEYGIFSGWALNLMLNSEVEIIEEDKTIKELKLVNLNNKVQLKTDTGDYTVRMIDIEMIDRINRLIREIKESKEIENK